MIIGSVSENINIEKRVAITPDIIKKYKSLGFEIYLTKDYASHIGIKDEEYETEGANIKSIDEVLSSANAILQMNILKDENLYTENIKTIANISVTYSPLFLKCLSLMN